MELMGPAEGSEWGGGGREECGIGSKGKSHSKHSSLIFGCAIN